MIFEMIPVGAGMPSLFGSAGVTSQNGAGKFDPNDYHEVLKDAYGMRTAKHVAQRAVELCKILEAGKAVAQPEVVRSTNQERFSPTLAESVGPVAHQLPS